MTITFYHSAIKSHYDFSINELMGSYDTDSFERLIDLILTACRETPKELLYSEYMNSADFLGADYRIIAKIHYTDINGMTLNLNSDLHVKYPELFV